MAMPRGGIMKDCNDCEFWRMRSARIFGRLIPDGVGKCTSHDPCDPDVVKGYIGEYAPRVRHEAQPSQPLVTPEELAALMTGLDEIEPAPPAISVGARCTCPLDHAPEEGTRSVPLPGMPDA
jgi:hypothetical protein